MVEALTGAHTDRFRGPRSDLPHYPQFGDNDTAGAELATRHLIEGTDGSLFRRHDPPVRRDQQTSRLPERVARHGNGARRRTRAGPRERSRLRPRCCRQGLVLPDRPPSSRPIHAPQCSSRATRDRTAAAVGFGVFPLATSSGRYRDRSEAAQLGEFDAARTERLEHPNMAPYCMNIVESLTDQTRLLVSTTTSVSALIFAGWLSCTRSRSRRTQNHVRNADA
jgi:hypothetical protein